MSKEAVISLTKNLGNPDMVRKEGGIRVDCVCPMFADTNMVKDDKAVLEHSK